MFPVQNAHGFFLLTEPKRIRSTLLNPIVGACFALLATAKQLSNYHQKYKGTLEPICFLALGSM